MFTNTVTLVTEHGSELESNNLAVWANMWNHLLNSDDIRNFFYYECAFRVYDSEGYYNEYSTDDMILGFDTYMYFWHNGTGSLFWDITNRSMEDETILEIIEDLEDIDIQKNTNLNW